MTEGQNRSVVDGGGQGCWGVVCTNWKQRGRGRQFPLIMNSRDNSMAADSCYQYHEKAQPCTSVAVCVCACVGTLFS